jgi:uncharacterized protein (TIGR02145 family)
MKKHSTLLIFGLLFAANLNAQTTDTMFVHTKQQFIHEFATQNVDSVIFYRTQPKMAIPCDTVFITQTDTLYITDYITETDTVYITDTVFITQTDTVIIATPVDEYGCNVGIPNWGGSLGTVSFATTQAWVIGSQIWSDAVQATNCNNTSFSGGPAGNFSSDCRSNPDYKGDLFTWCAVARYGDSLCPAPWRVPTLQDFVDLDIAMNGGTGQNRTDVAARDRFLNDWAGAYGGYCTSDGSLYDRGVGASYWSATESSATSGRRFYFDTVGSVNPQLNFNKSSGFTLRCVR